MMPVFGCIMRSVGKNIQKLGINETQIRQKGVLAAVQKQPKSSLVVEEVPQSTKLKSDEIKIKVHYCSVNPSDVEMVKGYHDYQPKLPFVPGYELAGEISGMGSNVKNLGFHEGDKVIALNKDSCGGFAKECIVNVKDCFHVPQGVSLKDCSALLDGYITALLGLIRVGKLEEGESVLITAAGGGVGLAAVDLAANVYKAKVTAVCSTEDRAALVREKGAFSALKYTSGLAKEVNSMTKGKGFKLIFDTTGGEIFINALNCISNEGRMVLASNAARNIKHFSPISLLPKTVTMSGISPWHYRKLDPEKFKSCIEDVIDMAEQELIAPHVSKEFELKEINDAFEYLMDSKCTGKIVVKLD